MSHAGAEHWAETFGSEPVCRAFYGLTIAQSSLSDSSEMNFMGF